MERNASAMLADVAAKGFSFRPHVKTLKVRIGSSVPVPPLWRTQQFVLVLNNLQSVEATRLMLGGRYRKVVVSTLAEIHGLLPLVMEGCVDEVIIEASILDSTSAAAGD